MLAMVLGGARAQFSTALLGAGGLTCALCSKAINNALERLPFVQSVEPDIRNSAFKIQFKAGRPVVIDAIKKAVEDAGFSVATLKIKGRFDRLQVKNDQHVDINGETFHFLKVSDQVVSGEKEIRIVDKAFLSSKEFKQYSAATAMRCVQTGRAESCCSKAGLTQGKRIYHVTM